MQRGITTPFNADSMISDLGIEYGKRTGRNYYIDLDKAPALVAEVFERMAEDLDVGIDGPEKGER